MPKPKALDLFCSAGGVSVGLERAGFEVYGVDILPQKNYPYPGRFIQGDALQPPVNLDDFDFIWASPPCQAYSKARHIHGTSGDKLIDQTRNLLETSGTLWTIENVPGAPIRADYILCGSQFGLDRLRRHRWFEVSFCPAHLIQPCHHGKNTVSVFGNGGHFYNTVETWREVMGIDWMDRKELAQAIPPAYAEYIGRAAMEHIA